MRRFLVCTIVTMLLAAPAFAQAEPLIIVMPSEVLSDEISGPQVDNEPGVAVGGGDAMPVLAQGPAESEPLPPMLQILEAGNVTLDELLWIARPLVVFADSPNNPSFQQQMRYIADVADELLARDVVVIIDTDPAALSDPRLQLRPRGFSLVLLEKDGTVVQRKPTPWTGREITHAIDRLPLRRQEMLEARPSGR